MRDLMYATRRYVKSGLAVGLGLFFLVLILPSFGSVESISSPHTAKLSNEIVRHIALLRSGRAQQKAAAAYWLGQQHDVAANAVVALVDLLGDTTEVDPSLYRRATDLKSTLGVEVAAALVNIGQPSIEPLIRVLKTSPQDEARKNAAWALGALQQSGTANAGPLFPARESEQS